MNLGIFEANRLAHSLAIDASSTKDVFLLLLLGTVSVHSDTSIRGLRILQQPYSRRSHHKR